MTEATFIGAVVLWGIPLFIASAQGRAKNRAGFTYGFFLGWLGVIILAFLPAALSRDYGPCPWCKEQMRRDASVCPHCQRDVSPSVALTL